MTDRLVRAPLTVPRCVGTCSNDDESHAECFKGFDWSTATIRTSKCRTGCVTQNHMSYAECARGLQLNTGLDLSLSQKKWDAELSAYRSARSQGIQPDGTTMPKIQRALEYSDATGVAYGADR